MQALKYQPRVDNEISLSELSSAILEISASFELTTEEKRTLRFKRPIGDTGFYIHFCQIDILEGMTSIGIFLRFGEDYICETGLQSTAEGDWEMFHRKTFPEYRGNGLFEAVLECSKAFLVAYEFGVEKRLHLQVRQIELIRYFTKRGFQITQGQSVASLEEGIRSGLIQLQPLYPDSSEKMLKMVKRGTKDEIEVTLELNLN